MSTFEHEVAVQGTSDDAAVSKMSAIKKGYYDDPFLQYFIHKVERARRSPLINRGYFVRIHMFNKLIEQFLKDGGKQILSLGAGIDTLFFRLKNKKFDNFKLFEYDFPEVTSKKLKIIESHDELKSHIKFDSATHIDRERGELISEDYSIMTGDLRETEEVKENLRKAGIDFSLPTMIISECVLVYIEPAEASKLIGDLCDMFSSAVFATYEQILPDDPFGKVMMQNLMNRGIYLRGLPVYPTLRAQRQRYRKAGFQRVTAIDLCTVYHQNIDKDELRRIERLEMFDEFEEWWMMMQHYCFVLSVKNKDEFPALVLNKTPKHIRRKGQDEDGATDSEPEE
eukprot:TRINITY_DN776200_c0_g1_i1.p1 TRINITY_DN776200_c0_g1~~TRINITY_DN776200_c0_g1_i1.p1  ORF type:complete len:340 (+),score=98.35 TRINITY_DN776200_c0_g1_i1:21-1040(+)